MACTLKYRSILGVSIWYQSIRENLNSKGRFGRKAKDNIGPLAPYVTFPFPVSLVLLVLNVRKRVEKQEDRDDYAIYESWRSGTRWRTW